MEVVRMAVESDTTTFLTHICEWCGREIQDDTQDCPALHDGRCQP